MKEKDRRIFTLSLAALLILLLAGSRFLGAEQRSSAVPFSLAEQADGVFRIEGEGVLTAEDVSALLREHALLSEEILDLILGDGVTELGPNAINQFPCLRSLKLGTGTVRVFPGGLRNCPRLELVFCPSALERIGADFLTGCPALRGIVTGGDGTLFEGTGLPVYPFCSELQQLEQSVRQGLVPCLEISARQLYGGESDASRRTLTLSPGDIQFGPYITVAHGTYNVAVTGRGFSTLTAESLWVNVETEALSSVDNIIITNERITYQVTFPDESELVEFCVKNTGSSPLSVESVVLYDLQYAPPAAVSLWW